MYTVKQRGGKLMKVKLNIDSNLTEEKAEFWIKKMTTKIEQITKELNSKQDFLWCYQDRDAFQVKYDDIFLIQVENEKHKFIPNPINISLRTLISDREEFTRRFYHGFQKRHY